MPFGDITNNFIKNMRNYLADLVVLSIARKNKFTDWLDQDLNTEVPLFFTQLFREGKKESLKVLENNVISFVRDYDLPIKYNKNLIDQINDISVFQGYYDKKYKKLFTEGTVDKLKRTILQGKYSDLSENQMIQNIMQVTKTTKRRAQLLARTETSRLRETSARIYFQKLKDTYDMVWKHGHSKVPRPDHVDMEGKKADDDGLFDFPGKGKVTPGFEFNCTCYSEFVKKDIA